MCTKSQDQFFESLCQDQFQPIGKTNLVWWNEALQLTWLFQVRIWKRFIDAFFLPPEGPLAVSGTSRPLDTWFFFWEGGKQTSESEGQGQCSRAGVRWATMRMGAAQMRIRCYCP